jgi:heat-inducible transcriptional repressor
VTRLLQASSRLLSRLSGEVGFVVAPDAVHTRVRSLRFLAVAPGKVLVVQVHDPDVVVSQVFETDTAFPARELEALSERLTREFAGRTLQEVRQGLLAELEKERAAGAKALARALEMARRALEGREGDDRVYVDGAARLLDKPEFADVTSLKKVFRSIDERARLFDLVTRYLEKGTCVVLGSESEGDMDPRLSAVLTSYGSGETLTGTLGVIGPARREYPRVIPVVELLGRALSGRLEGRENRAEEDEAE